LLDVMEKALRFKNCGLATLQILPSTSTFLAGNNAMVQQQHKDGKLVSRAQQKAAKTPETRAGAADGLRRQAELQPGGGVRARQSAGPLAASLEVLAETRTCCYPGTQVQPRLQQPFGGIAARHSQLPVRRWRVRSEVSRSA
jgi:hypothetical protein